MSQKRSMWFIVRMSLFGFAFVALIPMGIVMTMTIGQQRDRLPSKTWFDSEEAQTAKSQIKQKEAEIRQLEARAKQLQAEYNQLRKLPQTLAADLHEQLSSSFPWAPDKSSRWQVWRAAIVQLLSNQPASVERLASQAPTDADRQIASQVLPGILYANSGNAFRFAPLVKQFGDERCWAALGSALAAPSRLAPKEAQIEELLRTVSPAHRVQFAKTFVAVYPDRGGAMKHDAACQLMASQLRSLRAEELEPLVEIIHHPRPTTRRFARDLLSSPKSVFGSNKATQKRIWEQTLKDLASSERERFLAAAEWVATQSPQQSPADVRSQTISLLQRNLLAGHVGDYSPMKAYCRWATEQQLGVLIKIIDVPLPQGGHLFALQAILRMDPQKVGRALAPSLSRATISNRVLPAFEDQPAVARTVLATAISHVTPAAGHGVWLAALGRVGTAEQVAVLEEYCRRCAGRNISQSESPHREALNALAKLRNQ